MLETGRILQDRYRVERQVGQGGMGSVYLATDERFHSTVAIKEALFIDEKLRKAFSREARLLNTLKHSALPKVSDHFVEDNGQYLVMEYIGGDDLFEMMRKSGQGFPAEEVLVWMDQLLDALSYLHDQGIIHRDIKPQNLKLTPQKQIILLDFGLAKGNPSDANFQTAPQSIFGYSRNYASLEQIQGTGTDPRSDIYSLAATIYHLATGQVPADALTRVMMVLNENRDPLEPAGKFNPSISQEVSDALQLCLSLKAGSRPQNVEETRALFRFSSHTPFMPVDGDNVTEAGREELLTRNTLVFEKEGGLLRDKPSESQTEVIDTAQDADPLSTQIANKPTTAVSEKTSRSGWFGMAAAGAALFFVVGSLAAAAVFWPFGSTQKPVADSNIAESVLPLSDGENSNDSNSETADAANFESIPNSASGKDVPAGPNETVPAGNPAQPSKIEAKTQQKSPVKESAPVTIEGPDGVTIKNGTVRTRDLTIDEKGVVVRVTPIPPNPPPLTREQINRLTPAQRRRLQRKLEADRRAAAQRQKDLKQNPPPSTPKPPGN